MKPQAAIEQAMATILNFKNPPIWTSFLQTAAKMYKYPYHDQVLIHAQRPQAKACAKFELWNQRLGRWIKRGSKGIGLLDFSSGKPRLRYVFDISDTRETKNAIPIRLWEVKANDEPAIIAALSSIYGVKAFALSALLLKIAEQRGAECCRMHAKKIEQETADSAVAGDLVRFQKATIAGSAYILLSRCNCDTAAYFKENDLDIADFNTFKSLAVLGRAINSITADILRKIESIVKSLNVSPGQRAAPEKEIQALKATPALTAASNKELQVAPLSLPNDEQSPDESADVDIEAVTAKEMSVNLTDVTPPIKEDTPVLPEAESPISAESENPQAIPTKSRYAKKGISKVKQPSKRNAKPEPLSLDFSAEVDPASQPQLQLHTDPAPSLTDKADNYRLPVSDSLFFGSVKAKFRQNLLAIQTLKNIEAQDRHATPEEQEILSKYVGWGGISQAFDVDHKDWKKEAPLLKEALTETEYISARASTLNAFYTLPSIVAHIYKAIAGLGFTHGKILEPGCGSGNFFGVLPDAMAKSKLYGVEIDSLTARIARQLYPNAKIYHKGYEDTNLPDEYFDLIVGNVPFGSYSVSDQRYDKFKYSIHEYFIVKSLDKLRSGGIAAFIVSKWLMDKQDDTARLAIAKRAELLGAIRLPEKTFQKNAHTDAVMDLVFLQKRAESIDVAPEWTQLGMTAERVPLNRYFADHPEMVLGQMVFEDRMFGSKDGTTCKAFPDKDFSELLSSAIQQVHGTYAPSTEHSHPDESYQEAEPESLPEDLEARNFSFVTLDGDIYYKANGEVTNPPFSSINRARVAAFIELRDCTRRLIQLQLENYSDTAIRSAQANLNRLYDRFTYKFGLINNRSNKQVLAADSSYYLLCSLEILDEDGRLARKADMFTKRTIQQAKTVTSVDTAAEALAVSIGERGCVDIGCMLSLLGDKGNLNSILDDLQGAIYKVPGSGDSLSVGWQTADEYLSGNVREKLRDAQEAAKANPLYETNVVALTAVQPKDLDATEIYVRLGSTWIDKKYIQEFMIELLQTPASLKNEITVGYSPITSEWTISGKSLVAHDNIMAYTTYGTNRANAYRIIEETLNLHDVRVYDTVTDDDGKTHRVLNKKETTLAAQKQETIMQKFQEWIFADAQRREALVKLYNERFNAIRPREYDGKHLRFHGINPSITLMRHQLNAIARILYGGNTLLAHVVGAGKTFTMIAAAMESRHLGLCSKSMIVVPNHLTEQWAAEFLRLYPGANLLVTTKQDFEKENRKMFCSRIATGNYDAIIIGHSQFTKIPISKERQEKYLRRQVAEIQDGIMEIKAQNGERATIKQLERLRKGLTERLKNLINAEKKDDVITFEDLGVDRLFVDESHSFKNLFLYTKMRNVAGLSTTDAQKSSDMFLKCRYLDEITQGSGIIFATGTPISNSITEMYTIQRYLQCSELERNGLMHFDAWASTFSQTVTQIELAPEGSGYRARTRLAKFFNLPELMNMFKEVADIQTADMLNLPRPAAVYDTIVAQPTQYQKEMLKALAKRAHDVHYGNIDPRDDNMLAITNDGRKLGLDQRLMNINLPDDPASKVNLCADNILRIYKEGTPKKLTQLVFCDLSTPKQDGTFNVYDDLKGKLLAGGIPGDEIAYIHQANTDTQKKELFAKVRVGKIRVLIGSTAKMGAGTNVQNLLIAIHDLDCPWRPSDLEQRSGRIVRQGNTNDTVYIYRYVTNATFDSYLYQTIENKQKFIAQIMTSKSPVRSCDDVDAAALSYAEIKALCAGNPLIKEKMNLDIEVTRLKVLKADFQSRRYRLEDRLLKTFPNQIKECESYIRALQSDVETLQNNTLPEGIFAITLRGKQFVKRASAGKVLLAICKENGHSQRQEIGSYRGFSLILSFDAYEMAYCITLKGMCQFDVKMGADPTGNMTRIENALKILPERLQKTTNQLDDLKHQAENARAELQKEFPQENELTEKSARLAELNMLLEMDSKQSAA